jgi:hypothetical protein
MDFPNFPIAAIGAFCVVAFVSWLGAAGYAKRYGVLIGVGLVAVTLGLGWYGAGFPALAWGL